MESITVCMKDGTKREFREVGRAGGSYTLSLKYEGNFAIIMDEWGNTCSFPADRIDHIETNTGGRSRW